MENEKSEKKAVPPYVPFKTFNNFIEGLRVSLPSRIDKSLMTTMSGAMQSQLTTALRYLKLISHNGIPSENLKALVKSEGPERSQAWRKMLEEGYPFLFADGLDLSRATLHQVQERFSDNGTSGDTTRKCIAFFLAAAKQAELEISPHIKVPKRIRQPRKKKIPASAKKHTVDISHADNVSHPDSQELTIQKLLLDKFPEFDPSWPDEVKSKWFDGFKDLMKAQQDIDEE